jgi:putative chitinase
MQTLTSQHLRKLFPDLSEPKAKRYAPYFSAAVVEAKINTRARLCAFVAHEGHESLDLQHLKEIWGPTPAQRRYDTRVDLGNTPERDGDGQDFMGRGGLQRTGKSNYLRFKEATGVDVISHPELLEQPQYAFRSDALYWTDNKLNRLADQLTLRGDAKDLATFDKITKKINGGYNGRVDRQRRYLVAIATLPPELFEAEPQRSAETRASETQPPASTDSPTAPQTTHDTEKVLLQKLAAHEGAKNAAKSLGARMIRPGLVVGSALAAGNVYAWIAVTVIASAVGWYVYKNHARIWTEIKKLGAMLK